MVYTLRVFSSSKCSLFHNSNVFGSCIIHILCTECAKIKKKNNSGAKRLGSFSGLFGPGFDSWREQQIFSNVFGSCIIHILYTGCVKIKKKNNSGAKRLSSFIGLFGQGFDSWREQSARTGSGSHLHFYSVGARGETGRCVSCPSPRASAEVKIEWRCVSTPPICLLGADTESCTVPLPYPHVPRWPNCARTSSLRVTVKSQLLSMHKIVDISNTLAFSF